MHPDDSIADRIRLLTGERLLWSDRPRQGFVWRGRDLGLVPLGLGWCVLVVVRTVQSWHEASSFPVRLLGLVALAAGLWLVLGRPIVDRCVRARTIYGITDRRVVELREGQEGGCWSVGVHDLEPIELTVHRDGTATIEYGPDEGNEREMRFLPAGSSWWPDLRPRLEMVPNGAYVYRLLCDAASGNAVAVDGAELAVPPSRGVVEATVADPSARRATAQPSTSST